MLKNINLPPSYSSIRQGKVFLVLKDEYRDHLLQQGIANIEDFLRLRSHSSKYLLGRAPHACVPLNGQNRMVVRRYSHGGLLRGFTRNLYLFGARSIQELILTEKILSHGIPTVQPLGAIHHSVLLLFYKAYLLSLEIPEAKDLIQYFREIGTKPSPDRLLHKRRTIRLAATVVRQFHEAGFFHRDLQLKNILVSGENIFLIDFDRSYQKESLTLGERKKNLLRLDRSARKWKRLGLPITRTDRWRFFLAYAGEDREIREEMRRANRTSMVRSLFERLGWTLRKEPREPREETSPKSPSKTFAEAPRADDGG